MNTFSAGSSLRAGWELFKKRPGFFVGVAVIAVIASMVVGTVSGIFGDRSMIGFIVRIVLEAFVSLGVVSLALKAYEDPMQADYKDLWNPSKYTNYLVATVVVGAAVVVGFILLIVPGIIVALMFSMTKYLVVARDIKPIDAIKESMRITEGSRLELFLLVIAVIGINILGAICLLVGLLVTVPVTTLAFTDAYRKLEQKAGAVTTA